MNRSILCLLCVCVMGLHAFAGGNPDSLRYSVDLRRVENGKLFVRLEVPALSEDTVRFCFPKIVPGTYAVQDFGRFIGGLRVLDAAGRPLPVARTGRNQWVLQAARRAQTITYWAGDMSRAAGEPAVLPMVASVFKKGEHFVLSTPGLFGYFAGRERMAVVLHIRKPAALWGAGGRGKARLSATGDRFAFASTYGLYDAPILYARPDTVHLSVGGCAVTIAVCSGNKELNARKFAEWIRPGLVAAGRYLGTIPKKEFAFLYFVRGTGDTHTLDTGNNNNVLEHAESTYWYLHGSSVGRLRTFIANVSEHEFLHTLTPYSLAPDKLRYFDFQHIDLSGHSWLFEGGAEYLSMHAQVKAGLLPPERFLGVLGRKIAASRTQFNDSVSLFDVSRNSAGTHAAQFPNMYSKGVLLAACLDLSILHLSNGALDLKTVLLRVKDRVEREPSVSDERLTELLAECSYPEVGDFLRRYVTGSEKVPYADYLRRAGVEAVEKSEEGRLVWSLSVTQARTAAQELLFDKWLRPEKGQ